MNLLEIFGWGSKPKKVPDIYNVDELLQAYADGLISLEHAISGIKMFTDGDKKAYYDAHRRLIDIKLRRK